MTFRLLLAVGALAVVAAAAVPAQAAAPAQHRVALSGTFKNVGSNGNVFKDEGTLKGSPFGSAKIAITLTIQPQGVATETFRITTTKGTVRGTANGTYTVNGTDIALAGKAVFTGGTGTYKGIKATNLRFTAGDTIPPSGGPLTLKGTATF